MRAVTFLLAMGLQVRCYCLNGIRLDWSRSALLAGEVSVNELTADEIIVARKPVVPADTPAPEAGGFSLPELPVSITIGRALSWKAST